MTMAVPTRTPMIMRTHARMIVPMSSAADMVANEQDMNEPYPR
jgi:hypothetical protein